MEPMDINNLNLDELRHSQHKLEQFDAMLDRSINQSYFGRHISWFSITTGAVLITILVLLILSCCCDCAWLPIIGKCFPKRRKCCGFPSICITNNNERYQISERQLMRLSQLRQIQEEDDHDTLKDNYDQIIIRHQRKTIQMRKRVLDPDALCQSINSNCNNYKNLLKFSH